MEKAGYRDNLELLLAMFPGKAAITVEECSGALGTTIGTIYRAVKARKNPLPSNKVCGKIVIPIPMLARWMSA